MLKKGTEVLKQGRQNGGFITASNALRGDYFK